MSGCSSWDSCGRAGWQGLQSPPALTVRKEGFDAFPGGKRRGALPWLKDAVQERSCAWSLEVLPAAAGSILLLPAQQHRPQTTDCPSVSIAAHSFRELQLSLFSVGCVRARIGMAGYGAKPSPGRAGHQLNSCRFPLVLPHAAGKRYQLWYLTKTIELVLLPPSLDTESVWREE